MSLDSLFHDAVKREPQKLDLEPDLARVIRMIGTTSTRDCRSVCYFGDPNDKVDVGDLLIALKADRDRLQRELSEAHESWRCFHCDEVFTTQEAAQEHFGKRLSCEPACGINAAEYRAMEERMLRYNDEDSDLHREIYRLRSERAQAMKEEEERGYEKGLADARSEAREAGERDRRDAERYRWLRNRNDDAPSDATFMITVSDAEEPYESYQPDCDDLDAEIDAAIAAAKKEG